MTPIAGWYQSPDTAGLRWWDGGQWTNDVRHASLPTTSHVVAPTAEPLIEVAAATRHIADNESLAPFERQAELAPGAASPTLIVGSAQIAAPLVQRSGAPFDIAAAPTIEALLAVATLVIAACTSAALALSTTFDTNSADARRGLAFLAFSAFVASLVTLSVCTHRMYRNVAVLGEQPTTLATGWSAIAWILPAANLTVPFTILDEVEHATSPDRAHVWWVSQSARPLEQRLVSGAFGVDPSLSTRAARLQLSWYFMLVSPFVVRVATDNTDDPWRWTTAVTAVVTALWAASTARHMRALAKQQTAALAQHPGIPSWDHYRMVG